MDEGRSRQENLSLGYEFAREEEARSAAADLDRRFTERELAGLRIYRVRWSGNYLVEAAFSAGTPESRLEDARALLGESGRAVHPDDLADYKRATQEGTGGLPDWVRRFFGGGR
jgi:hypothetical protein